MEMRNDDQVVREGIPVGDRHPSPSPVTQAWAGSCGPPFGSAVVAHDHRAGRWHTDRTNVYVNLWRRLGELIGDSRFAFML